MLRLAQTSDLGDIQNLAQKIWHEHYVPFIGQAQVDYMLGLFYTQTALLQQISEGQIFYIIENEAVSVGFLAISKKASGAYFINKFYVNGRRKGFGAMVFAEVLATYSDIETIHLTVNKHNFRAINFYFKMGFVIEKTAIFEIGNDFIMDDFVMVFRR
jgi:ribosomal protein S18 acetylase RimI-like enzyme